MSTGDINSITASALGQAGALPAGSQQAAAVDPATQGSVALTGPTPVAAAPAPASSTTSSTTGFDASTAQAGGPGVTMDAAAQQQALASQQQQGVPGGIGSGIPAGPPAWNEAWRQKFIEAGLPTEYITQLTFTGAMGADEAQLEATYQQVKAQTDQVLAEFQQAYPEEHKKLSTTKSVTRPLLLNIAMAVQGGQMTKEQLAATVESATASATDGFQKILLTQILPWTLIPGWGVIRYALSPLFGGKDPISGDPVKLDIWNSGSEGIIDALWIVGGVFSLALTVKGFANVRNGLSIIDKAKSAGGAAVEIAGEGAVLTRARTSGVMEIAKHSGVDALSGWKKLTAYVPNTAANKAVTGIARFNNDLLNGIAKMSGEPRRIAELGLTKLMDDSFRMISNSGFGDLPMMRTNTRGMMPLLGQRNKAMFEWISENGKTYLKLDGRNAGKSFPAMFASASTHLEPAGNRSAAELVLRQNQILAEAGTQLGLTGRFNNKFLDGAIAVLRPGPLEDTLKAMANPNMEVMKGLQHNKMLGQAVGYGSVLGVGYLAMVKPMLDAQGEAAAAAAGEGAAEGAAQGAAQLTPEQQQAVAAFQAMTPQQQEQFVQQQIATLEQAAQAPNLSEADKTTIAQHYSELQLLVASVTPAEAQQAGAAQAGGQAASEQVPVDPNAVAAAAAGQAQLPALTGAGAPVG